MKAAELVVSEGLMVWRDGEKVCSVIIKGQKRQISVIQNKDI